MLISSENIASAASWMRGVQSAIADEYPNQYMRCPVHLAIGQELVWAIIKTYKFGLKIYSSHRGHLPYLALDGEIDKFIAELHLCDEGINNGNLGSMHIKSPERGHITSVPIVGSSIPLAVGAALAKKSLGFDWIPVAHFGDGACEEGIFHESLNMASAKKLPVLFLCENNGYSCTTALEARQPSPNMKRHAENSLIKTFKAGSSDCEMMVKQLNNAIEYIQNESNPAFLEIECFRFREHCGPRFDHNFGDRTSEEYQHAEKLDWVGLNLNQESFNTGYENTLVAITKYGKQVQERLSRGFIQ